jgi:3-hydroxyacyl-CoA dehydrogenase
MLLEATRILDEAKVDNADDIDRAVLFGLGFPAATGGLFRWADALGPGRILDRLLAECPAAPRFRPTPRLQALAQTGGRFSVVPAAP